MWPLAEVSPQPSAIPGGGNPPEDWLSAVGWGDARFEPETAGQQFGVLPLSHRASAVCMLHTVEKLTNVSVEWAASRDRDGPQVGIVR